MSVWTVSWQEGTGGEGFALRLAEVAGVPLVDQQAIEAIAQALRMGPEDAAGVERHLPGPLLTWGISLAATIGLSAEAASALRLLPTLREVTEHVIREAARQPCVVLGRGSFAILADHPGAYHLRLRAPFRTRVHRYADAHCLSHAEAERAVHKDDHEKEEYIRRVYRRRIDDPANFTLVVDASRFATDTLVELALAAAQRVPVAVA